MDDKNEKKSKKDKLTKEDDNMDVTQVVYNEQKFFNEFEKSLKEMKQMRKDKKCHANSSWRDLFEKEEVAFIVHNKP